MYHAIIFDLDGVICFTDYWHFQAWKKLADRLGIYFDEQINHRLRGVSRMESLEIILERSGKDYTEKEKEAFAEEKNETYRELLKQMTPKDLPDSVKNTLETLRTKGLKMAIGSSSKNAGTILGQIGLADFFDAISDGNNIVHSKPDPEVFLKAASLIGEKPEHCLIVEDAKAGIEAAYRGGFHSAGLGEARKHVHVTYQLSEFDDLLEIFS